MQSVEVWCNPKWLGFPLFGLGHIARPTRAWICGFCLAAEDCFLKLEDEVFFGLPDVVCEFAESSSQQTCPTSQSDTHWGPLITSGTEQPAILPRGLGISFFRGRRKQDAGLFAAFGHAISCQVKLSECNFRRRVALPYCFPEALQCCGAVSRTDSVAQGWRRVRPFVGMGVCRRRIFRQRLDRGGQGRVFQNFTRRYLRIRLAGDRAIALNRACGQRGRRVRRWRQRLIYLH